MLMREILVPVIVSSGTEWPTIPGHSREYSISLSDEDGIAILGPEKWNGLTWHQKKLTLEKLADTFVLQYCRHEKVISREYFEQRIKEIKSRQ